MSGTSGPLSDSLPDSIFTWVFEAYSGDSWGGWLVEDSQTYVVGATLTTPNGVYRILAEEERGIDLAGAGLQEGAVGVAWYRDALSASFLVTRNGAGSPVGILGLGSESDAAWNGTEWAEFGRGGSAQVDGEALPDSLFTWVFTANSGDILQGTLLADSEAYAPGDEVRTAHGAYRITGETAQPGSTAATGLVHVTRYYDANLRRDLTLESGGTSPVGTTGLGSELDRVWDGQIWRPAGQGGAWQADGLYAIYNFTFTANSGDRYSGVLFDAATLFNAGDTIAGSAGRYRIDSETAQGAREVLPAGSIWLGNYFDAATGRTLTTYHTQTLGEANPNRGLGNEIDFAFDGDGWDRFGQGGAFQADVEFYSLYGFTFTATSGDRYSGVLFDNANLFNAGDTIAGSAGRYRIDSETAQGEREVLPAGSLWLGNYFDAGTGRTLTTYHTQTLGEANPNRGLGNEIDFAFDGIEWDRFGQGGAFQADVGFL